MPWVAANGLLHRHGHVDSWRPPRLSPQPPHRAPAWYRGWYRSQRMDQSRRSARHGSCPALDLPHARKVGSGCFISSATDASKHSAPPCLCASPRPRVVHKTPDIGCFSQSLCAFITAVLPLDRPEGTSTSARTPLTTDSLRASRVVSLCALSRRISRTRLGQRRVWRSAPARLVRCTNSPL